MAKFAPTFLGVGAAVVNWDLNGRFIQRGNLGHFCRARTLRELLPFEMGRFPTIRCTPHRGLARVGFSPSCPSGPHPYRDRMRNSNPTILVVEDCGLDQELLARAFKQIGVTTPVHFVSGGIDAIRYLHGEGEFADRSKYGFPDLIITDLKMEKGDGFDLLESLREHADWSVVPRVVLTGSSDSDDIKRAFLLGARAYHVKPISYKALLHQLILLHAYWGSTEMPASDAAGTLASTFSCGKLGARFSARAT